MWKHCRVLERNPRSLELEEQHWVSRWLGLQEGPGNSLVAGLLVGVINPQEKAGAGTWRPAEPTAKHPPGQGMRGPW